MVKRYDPQRLLHLRFHFENFFRMGLSLFYHQIPTKTLKISQKNNTNISQYYHTSFQDDLVNFTSHQNVENVIIVGNLNS